MPAAQRRRLEDSWAEWFRREGLPVLLQMEPEFAGLYAEGGRPNFSVARLLGISLLQHLEGTLLRRVFAPHFGGVPSLVEVLYPASQFFNQGLRAPHKKLSEIEQLMAIS